MEGLRTHNGNAVHPLRVREKRPRTPGVAYAVLTLTLAVVVAALALTSQQGAPPTIAEFAPQAVERITDSSSDGAGGKGEASGEASTLDEQAGATDAAQQTVDVARVRQCVGDPARQIEDPQSPPCVPYWSGDNGGATSRGVSRDEIRVTNAFGNDAFRLGSFEAFFNRRFEFYGRQIRLIPRSVPLDPPGARAAAREVYEQDGAFASTSPGCADCGEREYADELARFGILSVSVGPIYPEAYLTAKRPYLWTYPMANDRQFATMGNWYCSRFAGRNAVHAGDPLLKLTRRKVGIILTEANWEGTSAEPLNAQLAACGERTAQVVHSTLQEADYGYYATFWENAILQMKSSGVTTVASLTHFVWAGLAMRAATNQGYFPEWLLTSYISNDSSYWMRAFGSPEQLNSLMLLLVHPMQRHYADHPSNWAAQEVARAGNPSSVDQWYIDFRYWVLLLLASGLQLAGPRLTPQTFERGLHQARFPNPAHRIMAGGVGFEDGDHTMTDDAVEIWWSNTARSPYPDDPPGTFCYVDGGARRHIGTFPTDDPFFKGPCDNGTS